MKAIPAIDLIDGQCVRLTEGDYAQKTIYNHDPVEIAKEYAGAGCQQLHLVDLDGAKAGRIINWKVLEAICRETGLWVDFGGGLKSSKDLEIAFSSGARQVTGGSIAVKNRDLFLSWLREYGSEKIILGADARNGKIAISGWQDTTSLDIEEFIQGYVAEGVRHVISTDISRDGKLNGPSLDLYSRLRAKFPDTQLIASGGIRSLEDLASLDSLGMHGAIIGKALYEGYISLSELKPYFLS